MPEVQLFGDFNYDLPHENENLTLTFPSNSRLLVERWRNNGLSADFMADYFMNFFPSNLENEIVFQILSEVQGAVNFIGTELLNNAMIYSDKTAKTETKISLRLYSDRIVFLSSHSVNSLTYQKLKEIVDQLSQDNDLAAFKMTAQFADETTEQTFLGFLTMREDYAAKMGWKFEFLSEDEDSTITQFITLVQVIV